jgi:hypothetical protein
MRAQADASSLLSSDLAELSTIVDRITSIAALALTYERQVWLRRAADALVQLYELGFDANGFARHDVDSARLWLYVLAVCMRSEAWLFGSRTGMPFGTSPTGCHTAAISSVIMAAGFVTD